MERTVHILEDILRSCIINLPGNEEKQMLLVDFDYNNSFDTSILMAPYEALYGRRCRSPIGWIQVVEPLLLGPDLIYKTLEKAHIIRN